MLIVEKNVGGEMKKRTFDIFWVICFVFALGVFAGFRQNENEKKNYNKGYKAALEWVLEEFEKRGR